MILSSKIRIFSPNLDGLMTSSFRIKPPMAGAVTVEISGKARIVNLYTPSIDFSAFCCLHIHIHTKYLELKVFSHKVFNEFPHRVICLVFVVFNMDHNTLRRGKYFNSFLQMQS